MRMIQIKPIAATWCRIARYLGIAISCQFALGCGDLMIRSPTTRYDGHVVRGVVTDVYTKAQLAANWDAAAKKVPDAPSKADYIANFRRVAVTIERHLGGGVYAYPFVPAGMIVEYGDVVDFPIRAAGPEGERFSERGEILRIVCKYADAVCLASPEGKRRGQID